MRINAIDELRGLAVVIMIAANAFPYFHDVNGCHILMRILFSTAAPIFIFLAGVSLSLSLEKGKQEGTIALRIFQVLFFGIFVDMVFWSIAPFSSMDVLYLISYSLGILLWLQRFHVWLIGCLGILSFSFGLLGVTQYNFDIIDFAVSSFFSEAHRRAMFHRAMFDGWFPLFPWFGVVVLGYLFWQKRQRILRHKKVLFVFGVITIIVASIFYVSAKFPVNPLRSGYTEIFYPVSMSFLFFMTGILSLAAGLTTLASFGWSVLRFLGSMSLPSYVLHACVLSFFGDWLAERLEWFASGKFLVGLIIVFAVVLFGLWILRWIDLLPPYRGQRVVKFLTGL